MVTIVDDWRSMQSYTARQVRKAVRATLLVCADEERPEANVGTGRFMDACMNGEYHDSDMVDPDALKQTAYGQLDEACTEYLYKQLHTWRRIL
jgi:hypothetical protein